MQWISVQERLPKTFEPVIVCREIGGGTIKVEQGAGRGADHGQEAARIRKGAAVWRRPAPVTGGTTR